MIPGAVDVYIYDDVQCHNHTYLLQHKYRKAAEDLFLISSSYFSFPERIRADFFQIRCDAEARETVTAD